jgi:DNA polymerase-3 subunit epsilon
MSTVASERRIWGAPLRTAEFLAVDTETNGRAGDLCELTEVGSVLVGGGELHDEWESLVRVNMPLGRGIQRFTGITQAMVDGAPPAEDVLPELARRMEGRVLVAHNASFDRRVLRQAFERAGLEWPNPPVLCTVNLARRYAPLAGKRSLAPLARSLGLEPDAVHRALVDARTCAQIFCALFPRLCLHAATVADAHRALAPRRRVRQAEGRPIPKEERPDLSKLPQDPGVYIFRDERGTPLYVGKSVSLKTRARAHFCAPTGWTERAAVVDYRRTRSELGALVLENRLIKAWRPAGNVKLKRTDGWVYIRCRLDIPYPVLEVEAEPAPGRAVNVGPLRGKAAAQELIGQLSSMYGLRHCGRTLKRRDHPSLYGQMERCVSPCLGDLDPNAYRRKLDEALAVFDHPDDGRHDLLERLEDQMQEAALAQRYERAEVVKRRIARLDRVLGRIGGTLRATRAHSRLVLARHPVKQEWDAFWIVGGRVADWGVLPEPDEVVQRTARALERLQRPGGAGLVPKDEIDEVRIVAAWLAANETNDMKLAEPSDAEAAARWATRIANRE